MGTYAFIILQPLLSIKITQSTLKTRLGKVVTVMPTGYEKIGHDRIFYLLTTHILAPFVQETLTTHEYYGRIMLQEV